MSSFLEIQLRLLENCTRYLNERIGKLEQEQKEQDSQISTLELELGTLRNEFDQLESFVKETWAGEDW